MSVLTAKAASGDYPANVQAAAALGSLTSLQNKILPSGNHGAFGAYLSQAQNHINDSLNVTKATNFMAQSNFSDFGSGMTNMSSMADQGLSGTFGSLNSASAALNSTGSMFNGISPSNFGTPTGLVQSLNNNKLGNASGVNALLAQNNVPLDKIDDPVYADTTSQCLASINDPTALNVVAQQYNIDPFGGLPSYNGSDSSLYNTQNVFGGASSTTVTGEVTTGSSSTSTAFGASQAPEVGNAGGIQSLKDLSDINKLANPADISGLTTDASGIGTKFNDMGCNFSDVGSVSSTLNQLSIPNTPTLNAAAPSLSGFMSGLQPSVASLTGSGYGTSGLTGPLGIPSMSDFTHAVSGGPEINAIAAGTCNTTTIQALSDATTKSTNLFSTAGIDLTSPPPAGLGTSMNFATSLHKFGADTSGSGIAGVLGNMAVPSSRYGDAINLAIAEGKNNSLLQKIGIKPLNFSGQ